MPGNPSVSIEADVAIIGGGFSGSCVAYQLLKRSNNLKICIVEPSESIGGIAYGTDSPRHLLNVRAGAMSLDPDDPQSFTTWLQIKKADFSSDDFCSRMLYRSYLEDQVEEKRKTSHSELKIVADEAASINLSVGKFSISLSSNKKIVSSKVVLAIGNLPFSPPFLKELAPEILRNPWCKNSCDAIASKESVTLIGSGLTAVDTILELEAQGFAGNYYLLSRHGLLPQPHPLSQAGVSQDAADAAENLINNASSIRKTLQAIRSLHLQGIGWDDLIEALRPNLERLYYRFSVSEQRRFYRHVRSIWEVFRHRVPRQSLTVLQSLIHSKRLKIMKGSILSVKVEGNKRVLTYRQRGTDNERNLKSDIIYNCMGLYSDLRSTRSPLLQSLLNQKLVTINQSGLGLCTDTNGQLLLPDGTAQLGLYTLGSLRRGELFETTAAREIREQAKQIAVELLNSL